MFANIRSPVTPSIYRANLKKKIALSQKQIREKVAATGSKIIHRTQAINAKRPYQTLDDEQTVREEILSEHKNVEKNGLGLFINFHVYRILYELGLFFPNEIMVI